MLFYSSFWPNNFIGKPSFINIDLYDSKELVRSIIERTKDTIIDIRQVYSKYNENYRKNQENQYVL